MNYVSATLRLAVWLVAAGLLLAMPGRVLAQPADYIVVDSDQVTFYDNVGVISAPLPGAAFYGQDAHYVGNQASYLDNGDGTVTDLNTGLMWQQDPGNKMTYGQAVAGAASFNLAGYDDWRLPSIKELYSLILFSGEDPSSYQGSDTSGLTPFINTDYFAFEYGNPNAGERLIDSQWATSTVYLDTVMGGNECFFGVNFADGRIKCYPTSPIKTYFVIYVRGGAGYGQNAFADNGNGTVSDQATGLMWQKDDNGAGILWNDALAYCEGLSQAGYSDWRLPDPKELQGIVDYSRSPGTTGSAAIDPVFNTTTIQNEAGQTDYPFYWTGTTHADWQGSGANAAYVSFGRAMGYWQGQWQDVHGAGAQRSDPKTGDPADFPFGHGPQGDAVRIYNYVRCVRGTAFAPTPTSTVTTTSTTTTTTTLPALCGPAPESGCRLAAPGKALVLYKDKFPDSKDQFKWKWRRGATTSIDDFADPVAGSAGYSICVYDASTDPQPLMESHLLSGGTCDGRPCWQLAGSSGFKYKDKSGMPDGVVKAKLKAGAAGKATVQVGAKGDNIAMPTLGLTAPVVVQLLVDDGASTQCWQTTYTTWIENDATQYKAKGP